MTTIHAIILIHVKCTVTCTLVNQFSREIGGQSLKLCFNPGKMSGDCVWRCPWSVSRFDGAIQNW